MLFSRPDIPSDKTWRGLVRELYRLPPLEGITLHIMDAATLEPSDSAAWNRINIGYCFLEKPIHTYSLMYEAAKKWDLIIAGTEWDAHHLKIGGVRDVITISPGIDISLYYPVAPRPPDGDFVVFSAGIFSYENGHDIVIRAMKRFMDRHPDVRFNFRWDYSNDAIQELERSGFNCVSSGQVDFFSGIVERCGIELNRCRALYGISREKLRDEIAASDLGLFPVRSVSARDTLLQEFLACGRPAIASSRGVSADAATAGYLLPVREYTPLLPYDGDAVWFEPAVDDVVERLEEAYRCRADLTTTVYEAALRQSMRSWEDVAREIHAAGHRLLDDAMAVVAGIPVKAISPATFNLRGAALMELGEFDMAESEFSAALAADPINPETYNCLGNLLDKRERYNQALFYFDKAVTLQHHFPAAWFNKGNTLKRMENYDEAIACYQEALNQDASFHAAWLNLGFSFEKKDDAKQAETSYLKVLELVPDHADALHFLGNLLYFNQRYEEAERCFRQGIASEPAHFLSWHSLGLVNHEVGRHADALECYQTTLRLQPDFLSAFNNMAASYTALKMPDKALECCRFASRFDPDYADLHWNASLALLALGRYEDGFLEYEWRWRKNPPTFRGHTDKPLWNGECLQGKTILLHSEQGFGDTLQFIRYARLVAELGASVVVECQDAGLKNLLETVKGINSVYARGETLPEFDYQITLMSIPLLLGTTFKTVPLAEGYLSATTERIGKWVEIFRTADPSIKPRIGLVWGGRKTHLNADRSMTLDDLGVILSLSQVSFFSLQLGEDAAQIAAIPEDSRPLDLTPDITDFADTAALLMQLDLVITIDTAVAHLAGAMGRPVWVMLKYASDWRWTLDGDSTPWYTVSRLFRQQRANDWTDVISDIYKELKIIFP